jgi:hypothetical protein
MKSEACPLGGWTTNNEQPITNYISRDVPFSDTLKDGIVKLS